MRCPQCRGENAPQSKFCSQCGARLALSCRACGAELAAGAKFCGQCGQPADPATRFATPDAYTPRHLAEKILTSRAALDGERKQVTVLFADMKGSMELLADRDPEDARKLLDPVLERMMEAVHHYEGTVNQVMGDGIMALFGAPLAHEDHAVRACYAALRMQEAIRRYGEEIRRSQGIEIRIRAGLNSGEVVVRSIGGDLRMDYTAVGQTTHLAARMEQLALPGTIRLTAATLALAEGYVEVKPLGPVPVKGMAEPVEVYDLAGAGPARTRLQAARGRGLTRFVGRDAEMQQLRLAADEARRGRGQVVAVVGEPGVGKSRLYYEFVHSHHAHGWLTLESGSVSYGKATTFLPLADLLRGYFKIESRDDIRAIRAKATGNLLTLDEGLKDTVAPVLWLLDALPQDSEFLASEPAERRRRTLAAVKRVLLRESRVQPLLLVFEDLHWVDAETQGFLDSLVASIPAAPILLAVNYRPEYRHGWGSKTYYRQLRIDPLPPESAADLLESLLGAEPSVAALKPLLIGRTEGNPLFLEESVRTLVETGALAGARGAYRLVHGLQSISVPPTVQAILASRIDRLAPEDKRLLQAAAVVGTDAPFALLQAIAELDDDKLHQGLARLQAAEFVYEARLFPELEYSFKHALTHEVAYGSVLQERRQTLHAQIVEAIERLYAERIAEQVELLAHHALRGRVLAKAVSYLRLAGNRAAARSANLEAVGFFEQALALLDQSAQTAETSSEALDIRIALGPALIAIKGPPSPEVQQSYDRALELANRLEDDSRRFPALWGLWYVKYTRGEYPAAIAAGEQLLAAAQAGDDSGRLLEAHHSMWPTLAAMGRGKAAVPHLERGLALYDRAQHSGQAFLYAGHDAGACCHWHLAMVRWALGFPDAALRHIKDALRLAEDLGHPLTTAIALWFATWLHYQRGEPEQATVFAEKMIAMADTGIFAGWVDAIKVLRYASSGKREAKALTELRHLINSRIVTAWRRMQSLCLLAEMFGEAGDLQQGRSVLAALRSDLAQFYGSELLRIDGELLLKSAAPDAEAAERCFTSAIELAREREEKSFELRAAISLARLWQRQGKSAEAHRALSALYGWFTEGFDTADLRCARALLKELS
jgi:class 3 adenylate cyclase/tetratricopeptide (TPR) repeat protein